MRLIFIILLAAAMAPARTAAQDPDSARATFERFTLCQGADVLVSTTFADRHRGRCVLQDARLLIVDRGGSETPILYTAVDSIWERGPGTRAGVQTGAWIGGGMGGALGAAFVAVFCEYRCRGDYVTHTAGGLLLGALSGAALGGTIGREMRVWIRRYPR